MRVWGAFAVGLIFLLFGAVWFFQGVGLLGGSFMTGSKLWLFIGLVVALAGLTLLRSAYRASRRT